MYNCFACLSCRVQEDNQDNQDDQLLIGKFPPFPSIKSPGCWKSVDRELQDFPGDDAEKAREC